jgi:hypothetical protein
LIDLKHYSLAEKDSSKQHPYGLRIVSQCKHFRSYIFYADHEQGCQYWIDAINATLDPYIGRHHACDAPAVSLPDEPYSVLDKWLNKLDLNDTHQQQQHQYQPRTPTLASSATTASISTGPYLSPNLRPSRLSLESLDSLPSETTLSSSTGSRTHSSMGQSNIFTPSAYNSNNGNSNSSNSNQQSSQFHPIMSPPIQYKTTPAPSSPPSNSKRNSNPVSFVARSLSSIKNQHSMRYNQHQQDQHLQSDAMRSPTWSLNSMTAASINNDVSSPGNIRMPTMYHRKDMESDGLFDFEEDVMIDSSKWYSARPLPSTP